MGHKILYISKKDTTYAVEYGLLYNWYVVADSKKISSSDNWVVPDYLQIKTLREYLSSGTPISNTAGGKLKQTGTTYWQTPNSGASNEYSFNGRGSGNRVNSDGTFPALNVNYYGWTSTEDQFNSSSAAIYHLSYNSEILTHYVPFTNWYSSPKKTGYALRLLYTGSGTPTSYTGNDGKTYPVVLIGTQYWIAQNLAETKFRDNSIISWYGANQSNYFTNTEWANLTSSGCCAYNNTLSNVGEDFSFPTS